MIENGFVAGILHDMKHRPIIPRYHYEGTVEQVGTAVADESLKIGTAEVYGFFPYNSKTNKQGSFSKFNIAVDCRHCSVKPHLACCTGTN
jgi:hypothetical protein